MRPMSIQGRAEGVGRLVARFGPGISLLVWLGALPLPAFSDRGDPPAVGAEVFLLGLWSAPIAWLANPLLWLAYVAGWRSHPNWAAALAIVAAACATVGVLLWLTIGGLSAQGGPGWKPLIAVPVWIASMLIVAVSSELRVRLGLEPEPS